MSGARQSSQHLNDDLGREASRLLEVELAEARDEVFTHVTLGDPRYARLSRYSDDQWDLSVLEPGRAASKWAILPFDDFPAAFIPAVKRIAWTWINLDTPIERLSRKTAARTRLSPVSICELLKGDVFRFLRHLEHRSVDSLANVSKADFESFLPWLDEQGWERERKGRLLFSVTRMWLSSIYLPTDDRLPIPPWEIDGIEEVLGPSTWSPENKTEPIHPETMSQLLVWAIRFVEDFSKDIFRAEEHVTALKAVTSNKTLAEGTTIAKDYAARLAAKGQPLPGVIIRGQHRVAREFIAKSLGIRLNSITPEVRGEMTVATSTPLPIPIAGRLQGEERSWIEALDYYEVRKYKGLLATACLIVTAYLSGMRGQEAAELRRGCCQELQHGAGQPARFAITGLEFKGALDESGNRQLGGRERETPWVVIEPVARAIRVAERLSTSAFVFDSAIFNSHGPTELHQAKATGELSKHIRAFMKWVNDHCDATARRQHMIPDDPGGLVNLNRLRRTLAWFIYRQPGGRVALGIQYNHVKFGTTDGYGSRTSTGLRGIFPMEEVLALVDGLNDAADRLVDGEHVSGPAAARYLGGIREFSDKYQGKQLTTRQLNAIRKNPRLRIFDNGIQPLACNYDATKALCHPDRKRVNTPATSPDLTRCNPNCGNVARTDRHIAVLTEEIAALERDAESSVTPEPMRSRATQRIASLRRLIERHEASREGA